MLQTSDFRLPTSDFRLQTSDFRLRTFPFGSYRHLLHQAHERTAHRHVSGGGTRFSERFGDVRVGQTHLDPHDDRLAVRRASTAAAPLRTAPALPHQWLLRVATVRTKASTGPGDRPADAVGPGGSRRGSDSSAPDGGRPETPHRDAARTSEAATPRATWSPGRDHGCRAHRREPMPGAGRVPTAAAEGCSGHRAPPGQCYRRPWPATAGHRTTRSADPHSAQASVRRYSVTNLPYLPHNETRVSGAVLQGNAAEFGY